jgi:hypothetical protein
VRITGLHTLTDEGGLAHVRDPESELFLLTDRMPGPHERQ